ncbi:hypothetical protein B0T10DRAFT_568254 [Thelonectria olida]|uniref:Uncharacterized protein n=1 Tax=Thelonectria olida TaxID=1576542 RepID=A0A9P8VTE5_9HYPO|nr:hypothetical protein B0T10DRAFT_568254 [Thelonectria olida]
MNFLSQREVIPDKEGHAKNKNKIIDEDEEGLVDTEPPPSWKVEECDASQLPPGIEEPARVTQKQDDLKPEGWGAVEDKKTHYFWRLADPTSVEAHTPLPQRFVAVQFLQGEKVELRFVPEKWWMQLLHLEGAAKFDNPPQACLLEGYQKDVMAYGIQNLPSSKTQTKPTGTGTKTQQTVVPMEKVDLPIPVNGNVNILYDMMDRYVPDKDFAEFVKRQLTTADGTTVDGTPFGKYEKISYGDQDHLGYAFHFDEPFKDAFSPADGLYIKLKPAAVSGILAKCAPLPEGCDEVYIWHNTVWKWANMDVELYKTAKERNSTADKAKNIQSWEKKPMDGGASRRNAAFTDRQSFWARNAVGRPFRLDMLKSTWGLSPDSWYALRMEAIRSLEVDKGWNRYIDPVIPLLLLHTEDTAEFRTRVAKDFPTANPDETRKAFKELVEDVRKKMAGNREVTIGTSPFNHYKTYIFANDYKVYESLYEKAWQSLIMKENAYRRKNGLGPELQAFLVSQIVRDGNHRVNYRGDIGQVPDLKYPSWMCHKIEYSIHIDKFADPLMKALHKYGPFTTTFYPFERPFFTKFEQSLDAAILDGIYSEAGVTKGEEDATEVLGESLANVADPLKATRNVTQMPPFKINVGRPFRSLQSWDGQIQGLRDQSMMNPNGKSQKGSTVPSDLGSEYTTMKDAPQTSNNTNNNNRGTLGGFFNNHASPVANPTTQAQPKSVALPFQAMGNLTVSGQTLRSVQADFNKLANPAEEEMSPYDAHEVAKNAKLKKYDLADRLRKKDTGPQSPKSAQQEWEKVYSDVSIIKKIKLNPGTFVKINDIKLGKDDIWGQLVQQDLEANNGGMR